MAAQRDRKRKELVAQSDKKTTVASEKAIVKQRAKPKSDETLARAQEALRAAKAKVNHERRARAKAEKALAEAQEALAAARLKGEQEPQTQIRRVSFIVRLMVDEHNQPRRTEIEQVESSRKQKFLGLNGERLVAFMKACISPVIIPEDAIPAAPPSEKPESPTPEHLKPKSSLVISDIQVFRLGDPEFLTLILTPEEPFIVQARFQLQGPDSDSLTTQEPAYEMKVYANEVTRGKYKLLTTSNAKLIESVLEYTASAQMPGLPPGLYRLFTLVIVSAPIKMAGFYGKTIINVT